MQRTLILGATSAIAGEAALLYARGETASPRRPERRKLADVARPADEPR